MAELTVVAVITAQPHAQASIEQALIGLAAASHEEEGCLVYTVSRSVDDPCVFTTIEKWSSRAALDAHFTSPAMAAVGEAMANLAEPPKIVIAEALPGGTAAKTF